MFQSLIGKLQTLLVEAYTFQISPFQSLIGKLQTKCNQKSISGTAKVSIPYR